MVCRLEARLVDRGEALYATHTDKAWSLTDYALARVPRGFAGADVHSQLLCGKPRVRV
jgi:hypothetical protein